MVSAYCRINSCLRSMVKFSKTSSVMHLQSRKLKLNPVHMCDVSQELGVDSCLSVAPGPTSVGYVD